MTAPLTLDEFTAALREAFPDAVVTKPHTSHQRWSERHAASLVVYDQSFIVSYKLNPMNLSKRWHVEWSIVGPVATAPQLRPLLVDSARYRAGIARADAAEAIERANRLEAAAKLIEANTPNSAQPRTRGAVGEVTVTFADGTTRTVRVDE